MSGGFLKGVGIGMLAGAAAVTAVICADKQSCRKSGLGKFLKNAGGVMEDIARCMGA